MIFYRSITIRLDNWWYEVRSPSLSLILSLSLSHSLSLSFSLSLSLSLSLHSITFISFRDDILDQASRSVFELAELSPKGKEINFKKLKRYLEKQGDTTPFINQVRVS